MLVYAGIDSGLQYTVSGRYEWFFKFLRGIVDEIHQTIQAFPIYYSTVKNPNLHFKKIRYTQFPQGLLLPTERIFK